MKKLFSILSTSVFTLVCFLFSAVCLAQSPSPSPSPVGPGTADFLGQVLDLVKGFGGLSWMAKVSGVILLILASVKVSFLNDLVWKPLGKAQVWLVPVLSIVAAVLGMGSNVSWPGIFAYLSAGMGAVFLHEILDSIKALPGIGPMYVTVINLVESFLGGGSSQPPPVIPA